MPKFSKVFDFIIFVALLSGVILLGFSPSVRGILQQADLNPPQYAPAKLKYPSESFNALETAIYGPFTPPTIFELENSEVLSSNWLDGKATVERRMYTISHGQTPQAVEYIFVMPNTAPDAPLILSQNFSANHAVISSKNLSPLSNTPNSINLGTRILTGLFGRHTIVPPLEEIIDQGYGFVAVHPPEYVADRRTQGTKQLDSIFGNKTNRPGALTVWASLTTALAEELKKEKSKRKLIAYGHSRYGKTALLAAAKSDSIDAVISHQSGTAGASLMRDQTGESLKDVMRNYPHWLSPAAAQHVDEPRNLPSDAHSLLAVISPTPILLGNARRDVWSDPEGAYQAAKWASHITEQTFSATKLDDFRASDSIAIWTRPGTHGVVKEDWPAFLEFLEAHFK